jgi:hypothetical protein
MLRKSIAVVLLAVFAAAPALAEVRLVHKPGEDRAVTHLVEMKVEQVLTLGEMALETHVDQFMNVKSKVGTRDPNGELPVEMGFESLRVSLAAPGFTTEFDSNNAELPAEGDPARPLHEMYHAIAKSSTTYIYGPDNRIKDVKVKASDDLKNNPFVGELIDTQNLRQERNNEIDRLPDKPVNVGDTWQRVERSNMGGGQTFTFDIEYTYAGTVQRGDRTLHRITGKPTKVVYTQSPNSPSPLKVTQSDLKAGGEVELLFDPQFGDVTEAVHKLHIAGDMTMTANEQVFPGKLDLKMNVKSQVQR